jgi:CBS domain-containing protein
MNPISLLNRTKSTDGAAVQQKRKVTRVYDVMTTGVLTLAPMDSFDDAIELMATHDYQYVIVTNDEAKVIGVVSQRDIVGSRWNITEWRSKRVSQAMRGNPVTVTFRTLLGDAIETMIQEKVNCLPVTKDNGVLCGMLSAMDIMKAHVVLLAEMERQCRVVEK